MRSATVVDFETEKVTRTTMRPTSACGRAVYSSRKVALGEASIIRRDEGKRLQVTHCHGCHGFHLTPVVVPLAVTS